MTDTLGKDADAVALLRGIAGILPRQGEVCLKTDGDKVAEDAQFAYMPQDTHSASSLTVACSDSPARAATS